MSKKSLGAFVLAGLLAWGLQISPAWADRVLYSVSSPDHGGANLRVINAATGATLRTTAITLAGFTVRGANGLARDPTTGKLWALLQVSGSDGRRLVTLNPATGVATLVGDTTGFFAGIVFSNNGTLYGVTGERAGSLATETLYTLNKTNGAPAFAETLGNGGDGEAIGYNPTDNKIYHASGNNDFTGPEIFESLDAANLAAAPVNIPLSGVDYTEALAFAHSFGNSFLLSEVTGNSSPRLLTITTGGAVSARGTLDHQAKGMAFLPVLPIDFDGDLKSDVAIYRDGSWSIKRSSDGGLTVVGAGGPTWTPVSADYDGDGKADIAVYLDGTWVIIRSSDSQVLVTPAGGPGFLPVPADYDGDGKADVAVYKDGVWSIIRSTDNGNTVIAHGGPSWIPVLGDFDGDGKTDMAVYLNGAWSILRSSDSGTTLTGHGGPDWAPVAGDYDGDGKTDIATYFAGAWSILRSTDNSIAVTGHGGPTWTPVQADFDGDGKTDIVVYLNGAWSIIQSSNSAINVVGHGGAPQDIPLN